MHQVYTEEVPWTGFRDGQVIMEVCIRNKRPPRPSKLATSRGLDNSMWKLIQTCWSTKPRDRPSMRDVVKKIMPDYVWEDQIQAQRDSTSSISEAVRMPSKHAILVSNLSLPEYYEEGTQPSYPVPPLSLDVAKPEVVESGVAKQQSIAKKRSFRWLRKITTDVT